MQLCTDGFLFSQVQNIWCWWLIVPLQRSLINTPKENYRNDVSNSTFVLVLLSIKKVVFFQSGNPLFSPLFIGSIQKLTFL